MAETNSLINPKDFANIALWNRSALTQSNGGSMFKVGK
jgi:hypothetical protein